jgi:hypothetical protein
MRALGFLARLVDLADGQKRAAAAQAGDASSRLCECT